MNAKWCFPSSNGGEIRGLNDSGIETFNDNPIKSLAREICQNSLDAVIDGKTSIVEFNTFSLDIDNFPDKDNFINALNKCLDITKNNTNQKSFNFFKSALEKFNNTKISMLRISDFNTTGLKDSDWNNLVNSSGTSEKTEGKGGSFGIGKNAPFACSELRTIFYSTLDLDGNQRSKGVSKLISFKLGVNEDGSDDLSQGVGYFGIDKIFNIYEITSMLNLDNEFIRTTSGTDIYVSGLKISNPEDFKVGIIAEILDGFLFAIWENKLEVRVNGYVINKNSLKEVISLYSKYISDNTKMCYELLSDDENQWYKLPIMLSKTMFLGNINFAFKLRYDGTNKVSMIRSSGMKIFDKGNLCPSLRYVGLAIIEGPMLNNVLRSLENPSHNKWEPQRSSDPAVAKSLLRDIYNLMTEKLNEVASNTFDEQIDIDGAGDYLPDEIDISENENKNEQSKPEVLNKIVNVEVKLIEKPRSVAKLESDEIGTDIETVEDDNGEKIEGTGYDGFNHLGSKPSGFGDRDFEDIGINETNGDEGQKLITVKAKEIRIFCLNKNDSLYRLIFKPSEDSFKGYISLYKLAEQNERMPVKITYVNDINLEYFSNKIGYFNFKSNESITVDFKIEEHDYLTMEVRLNAYKS